MTTSLTKQDFEKSIKSKKYCFTEYKQFLSDIYKVEYLGSFIKCAIQKTLEGVQIIYLDSIYLGSDHQKKLMGYITFVIAYRLNKNKPFEKIEFNKDGKIISIL